MQIKTILALAALSIFLALPATAQNVAVDPAGSITLDPACSGITTWTGAASWATGADFRDGEVEVCLSPVDSNGLALPADLSVTYDCTFTLDGRPFASIPDGNPGSHWIIRATAGDADPDGQRRLDISCGWTGQNPTADLSQVPDVLAQVPTSVTPEVPDQVNP